VTDFAQLNETLERDALIARTKTLADKYDFTKLKQINTDADGGTINPRFEPFLEWAAAFLKRIPANWEVFLVQTPNDIKALIDEVENALKQMLAVGDEPLGVRGVSLGNLTPVIDRVRGRSISSLQDLMFLQMIGDDRSSETTYAIGRINDAEARIAVALTSATDKSKELDEMLNASREATSKIAASGRARIFHQDGLSFQRSARIWLGLTIVLGLTLIGLAFGFALEWIMPIPEGTDSGKIASYLFGKLLILATVSAAVTFAAKQYSANRHNAVQNFHRSSALRTYRALLAASRDEAVHEAILHQAAQAIFAPSDTGYSKHGATNEQQPMLQLFQGITKNSAQNSV